MAYVKLFQSLLDSTIWAESDSTRIVWLTMLVIADKNGEVMSTVPGLAHRARVSIEACQSAIDKLSSPDKYSRSKLAEGRRIVAIEGGWELVNHAYYRMKASKEDEKRATAERVRRHRERVEKTVTCNGKNGQCNGKNGQCNGGVTVDRDIAEAEAEAESEPFLKRQAPPAGGAGLPLPGLDQNLAALDGQHDTFPVPGPENPSAAKETAKDAKPAEVQGVTLPAELETEAFRAAWADWLAYRRECKVSPYKPRALAAQLATLAEWGQDVAIESIRQSIRQQWRGLFEPKTSFGSAQGVSAESKKRSDKIAKTNGYEY